MSRVRDASYTLVKHDEMNAAWRHAMFRWKVASKIHSNSWWVLIQTHPFQFSQGPSEVVSLRSDVAAEIRRDWLAKQLSELEVALILDFFIALGHANDSRPRVMSSKRYSLEIFGETKRSNIFLYLSLSLCLSLCLSPLLLSLKGGSTLFWSKTVGRQDLQRNAASFVQ